jgi:hypothetical protein
MFGAWLGWLPTEAEYDALSMAEFQEFTAVIRQKMERGI